MRSKSRAKRSNTEPRPSHRRLYQHYLTNADEGNWFDQLGQNARTALKKAYPTRFQRAKPCPWGNDGGCAVRQESQGQPLDLGQQPASRPAQTDCRMVGGRETRSSELKTLMRYKPKSIAALQENCRYCGVRQLCDEYWMSSTWRRGAEGLQPVFSDVELKIGRQHGATSWGATVVLSSATRAGKPALLRLPHPVELRPDTRIRVLDAAVAVDPESDDQPAIVTLGIFSEMFAIP
jgi:hypothetical protein